MAENDFIREKPRDYNAERSVLGSMLMAREAVMTASEKLTPDDFYDETNRVIFSAIISVFNDHKNVDLITVLNKLREMGVPEEVCRLEHLSNMIRSVPSSANVSEHCDIVAEKSVLRRLIKASEEIEKESYRDQSSLDIILEESEKRIYDIVRYRKSADIEPIDMIMNKVLDNIEAASRNAGPVTGVATGFYEIDYLTAGLQKSDLILLAARPSMGKTALALNIAENSALKLRVPTAVFSLEMSKTQIANRILSMHSGVNAQSIRTGKIDDNQWGELMRSADTIADAPLFIDDTPGITVAELRTKCRKLKLEQNLGLIIIDYLQLMSGSGKRSSDSRQQEISEISRSLKGLAREVDCPVLALSQLSRAVEQRPDKRPMLSDLRESGAIEQDADVVMFIYRDEYYNKDSEQKGIAEVSISKQRNGPTGVAKLGCRLEYTRFVNLMHDKN
ncbi:MAG: replicative DNA helicase [Lachnospiraceae bacterium]|nr:replicative DNA helicase [Lachnospiraceae bacterium]